MEHCPGQTDAEYRTEFSIWSIAGSNLIVSTDIRNMTDIMKQVYIHNRWIYFFIIVIIQVLLNKEIIDINQDYPGHNVIL